MGLVLYAFAHLAAFAMLFAGRWAASFAFGVRHWRDAVWTRAGQPHPVLALRLARASGGVAGWYLCASLLTTVGLLMTGDTHVDERSMCVNVAADGPAARAGLVDGDRVVAVDGAPVHDWDELKRLIAPHVGEPVRIDVERGGHELTFEPTPAGNPGKIMIGPRTTQKPVGIGRAVAAGLVLPAQAMLMTARGLGRLLAGTERPELMGPVGVVREVGSSQQSSSGQALRLMAAVLAYTLPYVAFTSFVLAFALRRRTYPAAP